ncbi:MAG: hypothetical protein DSY47_04420 [Hydrogenothermus sp.]|nr:MAG: hypothetical protein DSY47_04420 [Hydrogenothermus sp.]
MKRFFGILLLIILFCSQSFANNKENSPVLLTIIKGESNGYLKTLFQFYKVQNITYQSYFSSSGINYIIRNFNNLPEFLVETEKQAFKAIKNEGRKFCRKYPFYLLDHCETHISFMEKELITVFVNCNIVCLELK